MNLIYKGKKEGLQLPLQHIAGIVEKKQATPIASHVLIDRREEAVFLTTTDLELQMQTVLTNPLLDVESQKITTAVDKLLDILRTLPDQAEVVLYQQNGRLVLTCLRSRFTLQTMVGDDFPTLSSSDPICDPIRLPQRTLLHMFRMTQYAMAIKEVRYYLNGLFFRIEDQALVAVATDSHRLAYVSLPIAEPLPEIEFILPRKTVLELSKLLSDSDEIIEITPCQRQVIFKFNQITFTSKLIDGKYPDYHKIIPLDLPFQMLINREQMLSALSRMAVIATEKGSGIVVQLDGEKLIIDAHSDVLGDAHEELEITVTEAATLHQGFSISYLVESLSSMKTEFVKWSFREGNSSSLLTEPDHYDYKYVLMPMRI